MTVSRSCLVYGRLHPRAYLEAQSFSPARDLGPAGRGFVSTRTRLLHYIGADAVLRFVPHEVLQIFRSVIGGQLQESRQRKWSRWSLPSWA